MSALDRVRRIVSDALQLPIEQVQPTTSPDDVEGWDSIQHLNMVLGLEQEFGVQFDPDEIEKLLSVELMAQFVESKVEVEAQS
jgi:acyl carrier protein